MPGGHGGGGPPIKTCPRCGKKSIDELSNKLAVPTVALAVPLGLATAALTFRTPAAPITFIPAIAAVALAVHVGVRRVGVALDWKRHCPHCDFEWRLETLPFSYERQAARTNAARLVAELATHGLLRVEPTTESSVCVGGVVHGRAVRVSFVPPGSATEKGRARIAVACTGEHGDVHRVVWALEDVLPRRPLEPLALRDGELSVVAATSSLATRDVLAVLAELAKGAAELELRALRIVEHDLKRCAYCHGERAPSEGELVTCPSCGTALHQGCWDELGRCPTLGCTRAMEGRHEPLRD